MSDQPQKSESLGGGTPNGEVMRFIEEVVIPYEGDECVLWPFGRGGKGYGYMRADGVHQAAHRYICKRVNGEPPSPLHEASHSCGNGFGGCVTKRHLTWKTPKENAADKIVHGTVNNGQRNGAAKLCEEQVLEIYSLKGLQSQADIAARFGVSRALIGLIHSGKKWGWLTLGRAA